MKMRSDYTCPLELTHDIIRGKWKPLILWQLNELLACEVIEKTARDGYPLKTNYFLKEGGLKIFEAVSILQSVGIEMMIEDSVYYTHYLAYNSSQDKEVQK